MLIKWLSCYETCLFVNRSGLTVIWQGGIQQARQPRRATQEDLFKAPEISSAVVATTGITFS